MHNSVMILLIETMTTSSTVERFIYYSDELSFTNIFFDEFPFMLRLSAHWNNFVVSIFTLKQYLSNFELSPLKFSTIGMQIYRIFLQTVHLLSDDQTASSRRG